MGVGISSPIVQRVFVDANILYSKTQRDWLYAFYQAGPLFQLYSTEDVFAETIAHIRDNRPELSGGQITGIRQQIQEITQVITDYDCVKAGKTFVGADPGDLHVHAAAVEGRCDYLLSNDRKLYAQLNEDELDALPYTVFTADDFFCPAAEASAIILDRALTSQLNYWSGKMMDNSPRQCDLLRQASCPLFAALVERAMMRKAGVSPLEIDRQHPLGPEYSLDMRSGSVQYLQQISDEISEY